MPSIREVLDPPVAVKEEIDHEVLQSSPEGSESKIQVQRPPAGSAVRKLIDIRKFSSLTKLIRVIAWEMESCNEVENGTDKELSRSVK